MVEDALPVGWDLPKLFEYSVLGTILLLVALFVGRVTLRVLDVALTTWQSWVADKQTESRVTGESVMRIAAAVDRIADENEEARLALTALRDTQMKQCRAMRHALLAMQHAVPNDSDAAHSLKTAGDTIDI